MEYDAGGCSMDSIRMGGRGSIVLVAAFWLIGFISSRIFSIACSIWAYMDLRAVNSERRFWSGTVALIGFGSSAGLVRPSMVSSILRSSKRISPSPCVLNI